MSEEERAEICYECTGYGDDYRWDDKLKIMYQIVKIVG